MKKICVITGTRAEYGLLEILLNEINNSEIFNLNWLQKYKKDNLYLVKAGHEAGNAIEIAGTNLLHSLSYPITGHYGVSHGRALGYLLPKVSKLMDNEVVERAIDILGDINIELDVDIDFVIDEALKYDKIYEIKIFIDRKTLQEVMK